MAAASSIGVPQPLVLFSGWWRLTRDHQVKIMQQCSDSTSAPKKNYECSPKVRRHHYAWNHNNPNRTRQPGGIYSKGMSVKATPNNFAISATLPDDSTKRIETPW